MIIDRGEAIANHSRQKRAILIADNQPRKPETYPLCQQRIRPPPKPEMRLPWP